MAYTDRFGRRKIAPRFQDVGGRRSAELLLSSMKYSAFAPSGSSALQSWFAGRPFELCTLSFALQPCSVYGSIARLSRFLSRTAPAQRRVERRCAPIHLRPLAFHRTALRLSRIRWP